MTKGCYTCRRRRIICDNGQPTCRKCRDAGKECLGYQKPLVWVKGGVASRGKMMGRSFDDVKTPASAPNSRNSPITNEPNANLGVFPTEPSDTESSPNSAAQASPETDWIQEVLDAGNFDDIFGLPEGGFSEPNPPELPETAVVHAPQNGYIQYIPAPWGMVDPLLKEFDPVSRMYLKHCTTAHDCFLDPH